MKFFYKILILLVICFVNNGALAHCKYGTKDIDWDLIGEKFEDARLRVYGVFPDPDTADLDLFEEVVESWYAVDKEKRFFHLSVVDGIVTAISWQDPCFITAKDIRIGDSFAKVYKLHPDAKFRDLYPDAKFRDLYPDAKFRDLYPDEESRDSIWLASTLSVKDGGKKLNFILTMTKI